MGGTGPPRREQRRGGRNGSVTSQSDGPDNSASTAWASGGDRVPVATPPAPGQQPSPIYTPGTTPRKSSPPMPTITVAPPGPAGTCRVVRPGPTAPNGSYGQGSAGDFNANGTQGVVPRVPASRCRSWFSQCFPDEPQRPQDGDQQERVDDGRPSPGGPRSRQGADVDDGASPPPTIR